MSGAQAMSTSDSKSPNLEVIFGTGGKPSESGPLLDIPGLPALPDPGTVDNSILDLLNIQGDILVGMRKAFEQFYFFSINDPASFKTKFGSHVAGHITSVLRLLIKVDQPKVALNVAFSQSGLKALGINDDVQDAAFAGGQAVDAVNLGDGGTGNWAGAFAGTKIHGVFLVFSANSNAIAEAISGLETLFGADITKEYSLQGQARPGNEVGHEMFGFLDGIGQPAVNGYEPSAEPGRQSVDPGVILAGEKGDSQQGRPAWMKNGSFLVFRQLKQLVPEFDSFLTATSTNPELLGARLMGRWKSGAPIDLAPTADNPALGANNQKNNKFDFTHPNSDITSDQSYCPFSAHIRKARTRGDKSPEPTLHALIRAGLPYGPEVTDAEKTAGKSSTDPLMERGLAFVSYQSSIVNGFQFVQTHWANNVNFPKGKNQPPEFDPIIGQQGTGSRTISGFNVGNPSEQLSVAQWVVSRGGEYFFSPSISALKSTFSK